MKTISKMYFDGENVIITDPCYFKKFKDDENWNNFMSMMEHEPIFGYHDSDIMVSETLCGDWTCNVLNKETRENIGTFSSDSGMVCVCADDYLELSENLYEDLYTIIPNFSGCVKFCINDDELIIVGNGNIFFVTRIM